MSVNADIAGVRGVDDPYTEDVRFILDVETARGDVVSRMVVDGPQLLWERFGRLVEITPPAPAGASHPASAATAPRWDPVIV
jgi:hypothetical protein